MLKNYTANYNTQTNRDLIRKLYKCEEYKNSDSNFFVPTNIQPIIFRNDLNFGRIKEDQGSTNTQRQFSLPIGLKGVHLNGGGYSGGALHSNAGLSIHEHNYLVDENDRAHPLDYSTMPGKRGVKKSSIIKVKLDPVEPIHQIVTPTIKALPNKIGGKSLAKIKVKSIAKPQPQHQKFTGNLSILNKII
tara:strand:- start:268 stop:834 length:567 start_codon:yes stop_codon:yes gene_type:complete